MEYSLKDGKEKTVKTERKICLATGGECSECVPVCLSWVSK